MGARLPSQHHFGPPPFKAEGITLSAEEMAGLEKRRAKSVRLNGLAELKRPGAMPGLYLVCWYQLTSGLSFWAWRTAGFCTPTGPRSAPAPSGGRCHLAVRGRSRRFPRPPPDPRISAPQCRYAAILLPRRWPERSGDRRTGSGHRSRRSGPRPRRCHGSGTAARRRLSTSVVPNMFCAIIEHAGVRYSRRSSESPWAAPNPTRPCGMRIGRSLGFSSSSAAVRVRVPIQRIACSPGVAGLNQIADGQASGQDLACIGADRVASAPKRRARWCCPRSAPTPPPPRRPVDARPNSWAAWCR